ncbi:MAG: hypothetical protein ACYTKC_11010 [Planctomycetota bacterium]|jgi:hypothetical protein
MRHAPLIVLLAALAASIPAPASAQSTRYVTSPAGYLQKPGELYTLQLGALRNMRFQQGDGILQKGAAVSILQLDYRLDNRTYASDQGVGRTWTQVTLSMSEVNRADRMSRTFSSNRLVTPVVVFQSKVTWSGVVGRPTVLKWGSHVSFPFLRPWAYSGKNDMLMEWVFTGGALANSAAWTASLPYYMDSASHTGVSFADEWSIVSTGQCGGPFVRMTYNNFHKQYQFPSQAGKTLAASESRLTTPNTPLIHTWGLPRATPLDVGARCNKLHIDPQVFFFGTGSKPNPPFDPGGSFLTPKLWFPTWPPAYGVRVGAQTAYVDAQQVFSLGGASFVKLPGAPPAPVRKLLIWSANIAAGTGTLLNTPWTTAFPRVWYR